MSTTNQSHHPAATRATPPPNPVALHIASADLAGPAEAHRFIGAEYGGIPISLFLVDDRPGTGPRLHRHPYPEMFIVHGGQAEFEVDGARLIATAGDIVIAPAHASHRFTNTGSHRLRLTAIHPAPAMDSEWLEPAEPTPGGGLSAVNRAAESAPGRRTR